MNPSQPLPRGFVYTLGLLLLVFAWPLFELVRFSLKSELYSHILLMPFVSGYLVWLKRDEIRRPESHGSLWAILAISGSVLAFAYLVLRLGPSTSTLEDRLALGSATFLCFLFAAIGWFFGTQTLRVFLFPLGLLLFMIPFPSAIEAGIEQILQHGSAAAAIAFFRISGMPLFYNDLVFQLPGFTMQVAPECSGIHSTLALFITSLVASYFFLKTPWKRTLLVLTVVPLGLLRNGIRIFVIGQLCVRIGPEMIDSYIHRHGGPLFFGATLIPFIGLMWYLAKSEQRP